MIAGRIDDGKRQDYTVTDMAVLTVSNLSKRVDGKWALWDVNLEMDTGDILGVFGGSGSGKSVLAAVIAGLETPSRGAVSLGETEDSAPPRVSAALGRPALAHDLTVYENLDLFASLWGVPRRKRPRDIAAVLELLGVADQRSTPAGRISDGEMCRLEIARALVASAELLVIDGLLDRLDADTLQRVWDHLLSIRRDSGTSVLVMTASGRVAELCGRIAVISRGRIGFVGRPDDFRKLAGEDLVVLGDVNSPIMKDRIQQRLSVVIQEQDGFLSFRVGNGERTVTELLAEFGSELGCVYLKRPRLEDALAVLAGGGGTVVADPSGRKAE